MARTHFYTCAMYDGFHLSLAAEKKLHAFAEIASVKWYFLLFFILGFIFFHIAHSIDRKQNA